MYVFPIELYIDISDDSIVFVKLVRYNIKKQYRKQIK